MKISKTGFVNLSRCDRYAALEGLYREKNDAIITFSDDLDDLMSKESLEKKKLILGDMYDEDDEDLLYEEDQQLKVMMPYYNKIEGLTAKAVMSKFSGHLTYDMFDTYKQKRFQSEYDGYHFYCFLDGYLEENEGFRVFETKATTTKKYLNMKIKGESIFQFDETGILKLLPDLDIEVDDKYDKKEQSLLDKHNDAGRYIYDLAFQRFVIENATDYQSDLNAKYYLAVLNSEYVYDGKRDASGSPIYNDDIIVFIDMTRITKLYQPIILKEVKQVIRRLNQMDARPVDLGKHCQRNDRRECPFYEVCFKDVPKHNSLFTYMGNHHGFKDETGFKHDRYDLINGGKKRLQDIPFNWLERENNQIQRRAVDDQSPFYDKAKIIAGIEVLKYPIYHLDFETFPCPLPRFVGEGCYMQSLFQYSIHIEHKPGVCDKTNDHYGYLAEDHDDHRLDLIKSMVDVIKPDGGSVLVYNIAFEKTRIAELAAMFPQYKDELFDIKDRLFDLMDIVKTNKTLYLDLGYDESRAKRINFYHDKLNGSYSIKKVLPIFSHLSYDDLEVANGNEAIVAYANFPNMDKKAFNKKYQELIEYCKQDTWAMVEILGALRKTVDLA